MWTIAVEGVQRGCMPLLYPEKMHFITGTDSAVCHLCVGVGCWLLDDVSLQYSLAFDQLVDNMAHATTTYRVESDGVAIITLSDPPLNALHPQCE